jgi:hypothetical protein
MPHDCGVFHEDGFIRASMGSCGQAWLMQPRQRRDDDFLGYCHGWVTTLLEERELIRFAAPVVAQTQFGTTAGKLEKRICLGN